MASVRELESSNPNIREQLRIWQQERIQNAQYPYVYEAFRQHVMAIGAPDPGEQEFDEFRTADSAEQVADAAGSQSEEGARGSGPMAI